MRISSKGQVTIPRYIRRKLELQPQMDVEFILEKDRVYLRKSNLAPGRGAQLVQKLRGRAMGGLSTDEILALTRDS
ncbi:MAG TPA: AbrB/MazE/SpoVT family DNA-binding domain-containing protein [Gammaproteobacteria bacterium]|nr:AbrB/MazE/SpoVT family DNA-binding domain-containing protein [Gammaproteobacteria bacterium]